VLEGEAETYSMQRVAHALAAFGDGLVGQAAFRILQTQWNRAFYGWLRGPNSQPSIPRGTSAFGFLSSLVFCDRGRCYLLHSTSKRVFVTVRAVLTRSVDELLFLCSRVGFCDFGFWHDLSLGDLRPCREVRHG
jgi:hypothetical protein